MKVIPKSISGTGNGVGQENVPVFIEALKDFEKLIRRIYKFYESNQDKTFSSKFHLLNNWHGMYRIDLQPDEFPYHLCNGLCVYQNGWNDLQLVCYFPLRFKAPTFQDGTTENMAVALVTSISMSENSMKSFFKNSSIPKHIKTELLRQVKNVYEEKIKTRYKDDVAYLGRKIESMKDEIKESQDVIDLNTVEIPRIKDRIKEIESYLLEMSL